MTNPAYRVLVHVDGLTLRGPWLLGEKGKRGALATLEDALPDDVSLSVEKKVLEDPDVEVRMYDRG